MPDPVKEAGLLFKDMIQDLQSTTKMRRQRLTRSARRATYLHKRTYKTTAMGGCEVNTSPGASATGTQAASSTQGASTQGTPREAEKQPASGASSAQGASGQGTEEQPASQVTLHNVRSGIF